MDESETRWAQLFADLEGQWEAAESGELAGEVQERTRDLLGRSPLRMRLQAGRGGPVALGVEGAGLLRGELTGCGPDWLLVAAAGRQTLVALAALLWVDGLRAAAEEPDGPVAERWTLRLALGALADRRAAVQATLRDGGSVHGTPGRIGADYLEIDLHPVGEPPRAAAVTGRRLLPLAALATVAAPPST